ncbi:MAG: methionine--tRNA ligase subunit beta, partial [Balneola sp.]
SWKDFQARINNELAAVLGNFVFRALSFTQKFADSKVPELVKPKQIDLDALKTIQVQKDKITTAFESFKFKEAISEMISLARIGNKYFTETEPWKTRNDDPQSCNNSLHVSLQICAALSVLMEPILPDSMKVLREQLGYTEEFTWDSISDSMLTSGSSIEPGEVLFTKVEDEEIETQIKRLEERAAANDPTSKFTPLKENIGFEDFMKLDIRAGEILEAEKIKKSDKLLKLKVDIGLETRTIVSGIAKHVDMDDIVGQKVSVVANLAPKKLMGVESAGMILMAEDTEGNLKFVDTEAEPGSTIT